MNCSINLFAMRPYATLAILLLLGCAAAPTLAAVTNIAPEPVITQTSGRTKPNLMFVLDDSGSMLRAYMPDEIRKDNDSGNDLLQRYGYWSSQCNGVAFDPNPDVTYAPPLRADGTSFPNATFTAALNDGYDSSSGTTNLSNWGYFSYSGGQSRLGWTYSSNGNPITNTTFYRECMSGFGDAPGENVFNWVTANGMSGPLKQRFANWYSYYRMRYLMMRTAVGQAMQKLDANTRVGFSRINEKGHTDGTYFRDVKPFDATQKVRFYDSLYRADPGGGTPLRGALSRVGRYYAKRLPSQTYDPVEYSCQRNYALLTTDGYWNNGGDAFENSSYGPIDLYGSNVGQRDANEARPMKDDNKTSNTLADVAQYYYATDLRTPALGNCSSRNEAGVTTNVCENNVPAHSADTSPAQHLTTFAIGFGVNGTLRYDKEYLTKETLDYSSIVAGTKQWPATTTSIDGNSGDARNIDDLWHAAVNGRGQYYSALDSSSLTEAIVGIAARIKEAVGAAAAASFNTLAFVPGTGNRVYQATFTASAWTGELKAYSVDGASGDAATELWSAATGLDGRSASGRRILYRRSATNATLSTFDLANLTADGYLTHFNNLCTKLTSHCTGLDDGDRVKANTASNLINYLRGDRTFEDTNSDDPLFRARKHVLGDIIHGAPVFVGKPPFGYIDAGYSGFVSAQSSRRQMVYAAANDGMLHAFDAATGAELWAYVPSAVIPNLHKLADFDYATKHSYSVDGEPVVGDIQVGGVWKTVLIGGLGAGGRAYYALDITDPLNPTSLWEFTDTNLGLTYSVPIITKRDGGTWVVAFTSGLNNVSPGDGRGHLYVLNANTGARLLDILTSAGTTTTPSGLMRLNAWIEKSNDNLALRFYAGDMLGNLWRFDIDNLVQPYGQAQRIAEFKTPAGAVQPVTTRPEILTVQENGAGYPVVVVGTGRYLGSPDITDASVQSLYAIKDPMIASGWGNVREHASVTRTTVAVSGTTVNATNVPVAWASSIGWYFDFPNSGERVVAPMSVLSNTLTVGTTVPNTGICSQGGSSWFYRINLVTGLANPNIPFGELFSTDSIIIGLTGAKLADGTAALYVKDSTGATKKYTTGVGGSPGSNDPRRSSWRELIN